MPPPIASSTTLALSRYASAPTFKPTVATHHNAPTDRAKATAQEFEAVFLSTMFNQMFEGLKGDGPFGGAGDAGVWRSFLADEYARNFARAGGIGIADQVYSTLLKQQEVMR